MLLKLYHKNFRKRRAAELAKADYMCQRCGVRNRSFAFTSEGELYILYLHIAHVFKGEKQTPNASLIVLCPKCHFHYDHPRGSTPEGVADWEFIGEVARRFIEQESRMTGRKDENHENS